MNGWLLHRFDTLRRELLAAGTFDDFCEELHRTHSPAGALSLYEVIDSTTPEQWQEAVERMSRDGEGQLSLSAGGG